MKITIDTKGTALLSDYLLAQSYFLSKGEYLYRDGNNNHKMYSNKLAYYVANGNNLKEVTLKVDSVMECLEPLGCKYTTKIGFDGEEFKHFSYFINEILPALVGRE